MTSIEQPQDPLHDSEEHFITVENMKQYESVRMMVQIVLALRKYAAEFHDEEVAEIVKRYERNFDRKQLTEAKHRLSQEKNEAIEEYMENWSLNNNTAFRNAFKKVIKANPHFLNDYISIPEAILEKLEEEVYHMGNDIETIEEEFDKKAA